MKSTENKEHQKNFVHLHLHTEYSLLDGVGKIKEYIDRAKELGMQAIAITDHGNMFGAMEFYKAAIKKGIKPIIGIEAYIAQESALTQEKNDEIFHLILLAKNEIGYKNLLKLSSFGYIKGFYYKPRIDKTILREYSEGLIGLSACMKGEVPFYIQQGQEERAAKSLDEYMSIFGKENFYIELQSNGVEGQAELNAKLDRLAKTNNIKTVATNDTHYVYHGDDVLQDILLCLATGSKVDDANRMRIETPELYFKSREQMLEKLPQYEDAIDNTLEIAAKCNLELELGKFKFPHYVIPEDEESIESYLKKLVYGGMEKKYPDRNKEVIDRVEYELGVINSMGYAAYFVVVWDFIHYARSVNIPVGPGRGSAAGSIVAYLLGITELDPIRYNLIFERFLNPQRISMPDIDIDICQERRQEVIDYVTRKYGTERVAQIITFGTMKARAAIRDVGRVSNISLAKIDKVAKLIPPMSTLDDALKHSSELQQAYKEDDEIQRVIEYSRRLEGKVRHASVHAAGVVIAKDPLEYDVPLYRDSKTGIVTTQFQMKELEEIGLIKMDFLGLRNLTIIQRAVEYIAEAQKINLDIYSIPLDDEKTYNMLKKGDTFGVFQLESEGMRRLITKMAPDKFEDIIAILALYRPGPLGSGMVDDYINVKHGRMEPHYPHPWLEEVLKETYGVILYQEQVMKCASILADYSLGEADLLRRAMGKKITEIMDENRSMFVDRASKKGIEPDTAQEIFDLIAKFADYGFNKSHSAAYALVAYWTAYFKANYPVEYFAALMTSERNDMDKLAVYIEDAKEHGVEVLKPDINTSLSNFTVKDNKILFGLSSIRDVGEKFVEDIIRERNKKPFTDFENFVMRAKKADIGISKKNVEALTLSGGLDLFPGTRREKIECTEELLKYITKKQKKEDDFAGTLFGGSTASFNEFKIPVMGEYDITRILNGEKEYLGIYFSGHPMDKYRHKIKSYRIDDIKNILENPNARYAKLIGIIRELKKKITKRGEVMADFVLEDYYGKIKVTVFPRDYMKLAHLLTENNIIYVEGNINIDYFGENEEKKLIGSKMKEIDEMEEVKSFKVYLGIDEKNKMKMETAKALLLKHPGKDRVYVVVIEDGHKTTLMLDEKYSVNPSDRFVKEIEEVLGKGRIKIV